MFQKGTDIIIVIFGLRVPYPRNCLLYTSPIVLLDEATASLDPENEVHIQDAINDLVKEKTVVIIAHRLRCV